MNILLINTLYPPSTVGGAERSVKNLAEELAGLNHAVTVISLGKSRKKEDINGVAVYRLPLKNVYWPYDQQQKNPLLKSLWHVADMYNPWMEKAVMDIADKERPDIIHTHNLQGFSTNIWNTGRTLEIPLVHTLRDYWLRCPGTVMYRNNRNCERPCAACSMLSIPKKKASAGVQAVAGISRFILNNHLVAGYFPGVKYKAVIPNTITAGIRTSSVPAKNKTNEFKAGFLGRLSESKGIKMLADAFHNSDIPLLLGGKGNAKILKYIAELNAPNIRHLGYVRPGEFFRKIDILIVPSLWHEPFGRVVIEAYGYGIPVLVSDRGGLGELVDEGETGFVFDPGSGFPLERIRQLKNNPELLNKLKTNSYRKAQQYTSPQAGAANYLTLYQKCYEAADT